MALYAFNVELALVHERVSEGLLGEMRFQWWQDQVSAAFDKAPRPEGYAGTLHDFIGRHKPLREELETLITGRARDLSQDSFKDMEALKAYCVSTNAPLVRLTSQVLCPEAPLMIDINELADELAITWALTGIIRSIPIHRARGRCLLPDTLMTDHGVTQETVYMDENRSALLQMVADLAKAAEHSLKSAKQHARDTDKRCIPCLLPLTLSNFYLSGLRKAGFDPFHHWVQMPNRASRIVRLAFAAWHQRV